MALAVRRPDEHSATSKIRRRAAGCHGAMADGSVATTSGRRAGRPDVRDQAGVVIDGASGRYPARRPRRSSSRQPMAQPARSTSQATAITDPTGTQLAANLLLTTLRTSPWRRTQLTKLARRGLPNSHTPDGLPAGNHGEGQRWTARRFGPIRDRPQLRERPLRESGSSPPGPTKDLVHLVQDRRIRHVMSSGQSGRISPDLPLPWRTIRDDRSHR